MNHVRGVLMLVAAAVAIWRGLTIHSRTHAHAGTQEWTAYGLAALALGLAVWHLTRKTEVRRG